jgi:hypothetical protein
MENVFLVVPFMIGLLHCVEPDHLLAVSSLVKNKGTLVNNVSKGVSWGAGHSIPVMCLGILYVFFNMTVERYINLELPVGVMLIMLGIVRLRQILKNETHNDNPVSNFSFLSVGMVHGLAGTVGIVVLLSARQNGVFHQLYFLTLFCIGLMFGMGIMTGILSHVLPLITRMKRVRIVVPLASLTYGIFIVFQNL